MDLRPISATIRTALTCAGVWLLAGAAQAQVATTAAQFSQKMDSSAALFASHNYSGAQAVLFSDNTNPPGTSAWSLEAGQKLAQFAATFVNRRDRANAAVAASQAITCLQAAETQFLAEGKPASAARAQEVIGATQELILHDNGAAQTAYQKALVENPASEAAQRGIDRIKRKESGGT